MINIKYFLVVQLLFSFCLCEISNEQKGKFLNGFLEYYNGLPNQVYHSQEGSVVNTQQVDDTIYQIVARVRVAEIQNVDATKLLNCTATLKDLEVGVTVINGQCEDAVEQKQSPDVNPESTLEAQVEVSEPTVERKPVQLDNEVQAETAITSGEQFVAIPRDQPSAPCVGCSSHVNPQAAGVSDFANLGVRHLDLHEPGVKHTLQSVIDVERQVQVVNGVRYILTLSINSNNCTQVETENCASSKTCKITILVKPWVKLSNGGNYRAILANNCTEEWLFGEHGEVLPEPSPVNNQSKGNTSVDSGDDDIQIKHNTDVQSQPNQERSLTDEDIKKIQVQIISFDQFQAVTESERQSFTTSPDTSFTTTPDSSDVSKQHVFKIESENRNENSIPVTESEKTEHQAFNINLDKKKAIDDMLDFFDFSGFKPKTEAEDVVPRVKRSYDYDLQVLSLAEDYRGIKNSIENARFMYEMAQAMVDYLNEMDMEVKNRAVKNVIRAEEETDNLQRFAYIQARVTIPCDKVECESRDVDTQICNGVLDCTIEKNPRILNTFCYNDNKDSDYREDIKEISTDDLVLQKMAEEAVKQIESESKSQYALGINKIASAIIQVTSGTLTKFSVVVENLKCNKSVPLSLRVNCTVLEQLGTKICDVIVHERHWLKEKKVSYTCTDRPADMRISKTKKVTKNVTTDDPEIIEMLQEAIQYLESQSDKSNKQKIVSIQSISSQIIAGFLTKIEFVVGYTDCTDESYARDQINKCELVKGEAFRSCKAQIWDRSWIMDGRQIEVSCDDVSTNNELVNTRNKRSIDSTSDQEEPNLSKDSDLNYNKLANESLYKFMQSSNSHQHYELVKVDKVTVQDVSRKLIIIDFSISPTDCFIQNDGILSSSECEIVNPKNILHCRSKILESNWIEKKQYFVKCKIKYQPQKFYNELKQRNPKDSKYYQLAEESLTKYLQDTGNPHHVIVRVEKVTTQIVSGLLTRIDFVVSPKSQSASDSKNVRCHSEILEKHWIQTKYINVSCQMKQKIKSIDKINIDDPKYMQIAVESLQKYIQNKPETHLVRVAFVDKVLQKGKTIIIRFIASHAEEGDGDTLCFAEVSETTESKRDRHVNCHLIGKIFRKAEIVEDDPNYYKYVQLADECLHNYLKEMNNLPYSLLNIVSVTVQWDDGIKTIINFNISPDSENSELSQSKHCIAELLEQPWLHKNKIIQDVKCELEKDLYRSKRQVSIERDRRQLDGLNKIEMTGGEQDQDPTDPKYRILAEESLQKYVVDSGITQPLLVTRVVRVTSQVVSGSLTRLDFVVTGSSDSTTIECHSKVWNQPWLNKKEITVSCISGDHRSKRNSLGGTIQQNPTDPKYRALAEESLQKYAVDSGITQPLQVTRVGKVTTQVVAGKKTVLDFLVSGTSDSTAIECHSEIWEQPWLNKREITVSCKSGDHRSKRELPGGTIQQNPTDPKYRELAEESLQKYAVDSGITQPLAVARIDRVTTQVVSGSLTCLDFVVTGSSDSTTFKCKSKVWEQPWLNKKEITVSCEEDSYKSKREIPLASLGGEKHQNPTDPKYRVLAEESLQKYAVDSGITQALAVARIDRVTTQVVSGSLTCLDFVVTGSSDSTTFKCKSKVWEQPWLNKKEITVSCEEDSYKSKREIPLASLGGEQHQNPTDPKYRALAEESLRKYAVDSGITQPLAVARIDRVTTQVVSGSLTCLDFVVTGSSDSTTFKCKSKVWEQPWLNKKEITVSCEEDSYKSKREIPLASLGGEQHQNPTDPKYRALAEESLRKYAVDSGITQPLAVARIDRVTTQVVSGSLTCLDFVVTGSSDSTTFKCKSKVWEQPWLNKKEITVSCEEDSYKSKREIPLASLGGEQHQNPTDPKYRALAEESLRKYAVDSGITQPLAVARIDRVTTQVVSGSLTCLDFVVTGSSDSTTFKCKSKVWEQPWLNKKEITVSCEEDSYKSKREIPLASLGGEQHQNPTDPKYRALAEESLRKYAVDSGITQPLAVARIDRVTTQVVSGSLTCLDFVVTGSSDSTTFKCKSKVWEQPWLNKKEITVSCEEDSYKSKREIPLASLGGEQHQNPTDPKYRALAEESLRKYAVDSGITQPLAVARIDRVTTQVVSGSLTCLDFVVTGSSDSTTFKCKSKVWEQPWLNKKEITVSCEEDSYKSKREIPLASLGGEQHQNPTDPKYRALAEESLRKYAVDSGITQPLAVAQVVKVTTQTVSGTMTRLDFLVSGTSDSTAIECHSDIWEQPWLNKRQITVSCRSGDHRSKSAILGGEELQNPTDPKYRAFAEQSLRKYTIDSGIRQPLELLRIEKVSTQVVAGLLTRIDFVVSVNRGSTTIICHSKILEQGWLNNKEIDVSCHDEGNGGIDSSFIDQDPTKPLYKALAEESLRKYVSDSGITQSLEVARVERVITQLISGVLETISIDFTISGSYDSNIIKCHSDIWDRPSFGQKDMKVSCFPNNERVKRDLIMPGGASKDSLRTFKYQYLDKEWIRENDTKNDSELPVRNLRGRSEEEEEPNKPEYKQLAEEALRKLYRKKSTVYHKVVAVQHVVIRVVSGLKYQIDFTAAPTSCSANVSSVRARSCKADDDVVLYCHTEIWDRPWLKLKKIDVQCNSPAEYETDNDVKPSDPQNNNEKYMKLAEEASEKYLTTSNRKYVHKVTQILSASEQVADGTLINIDFSISPTTCLRNETTNKTSCTLKQPLVVFNCNANIRSRPWLNVENDITVTCKKLTETKGKKSKRQAGDFPGGDVKQNVVEDEDEIDEDTTYYYADRAVQHLNDQSGSNNLHKLITIHAVQNSVQMETLTVKMYIEVAETFCLRHHKGKDLRDCEEMSGLNHRLCMARLWPSPEDELVVRHVSVVCDDEEDFASITGVNIPELIRISVAVLESPDENKFKLVHQGEPQVIPSLDSRRPFKLDFIIAITNCSKDVNLDKNPFQCYLNPNIPARHCRSYIWLKPEAKYINYIDAKCMPVPRSRRSLDPENVTLDNSEIQSMVGAALEQLEMQSLHRYKQRVLQINSHSTRITSGKVTTIDFDVGYTSCLKYEWVANITSCNFLEHLPRRRCVAQIWERLWISNGKNIDVNCVDDETPLESHIEFESAEMANELAKQALKHIEAKYPHPSKQKVVRIFSLEKQVVAGIHYKMKVEVGFTDCLALSNQKDCKLVTNHGLNKFCRVNVWVRPWTDHPPNFRVACDYQEGATHDLYHHVQAEHLFLDFLTTYSPSYVNNYSQMHTRFEIFKNNIKKIHELNVHEKGTAVYGVTRFTDLTYEEFSTTYMGLNTNLTNENQVPMKQADIPNIKVPDNFDWREYDAVTEVKDQGSCGSCWAFSVTGNIEGQWKMQSGKLVSLSEQELVDCDKLDNGCSGGLPDNAYRSIEQMGGLELETDYPYEGTDDKCVFNKTLAKVQISSAVNITTNETGMAQWLVHNGPISIGINANAMQFYMGGISHPWKMLCNPTNLDHGVLIVGYGVKDYPLFHKKLPYWIIKNSWGQSWGEQGYYRVYRGDGTCGVNQMASSAVI